MKKKFSFWQPYFATKLPKEKFDFLCNDSNNISELEFALTSDLLFFINNCSYDIGESYFVSLDKITICRICNREAHNSLLSNHINSKEHKNTEKSFKGKIMTHCERCNLQVRIDG